MHAHKDTTEDGGVAGAAASALTPEQALIIQTRARTVPPRWRHKFFSEIANQLTLTRSPTNKDISEICAAARRAIAVGIGVPSVEDY
jgi:hypothetical protein